MTNSPTTAPLSAEQLDLLPCPFCGGTDTFVERLNYSAAYVQCDSRIDEHCACLARGPIGVQDDDGEEIPGGAAATRAWNNQAALMAQVRAARPDGLSVAHSEVTDRLVRFAAENTFLRLENDNLRAQLSSAQKDAEHARTEAYKAGRRDGAALASIPGN